MWRGSMDSRSGLGLYLCHSLWWGSLGLQRVGPLVGAVQHSATSTSLPSPPDPATAETSTSCTWRTAPPPPLPPDMSPSSILPSPPCTQTLVTINHHTIWHSHHWFRPPLPATHISTIPNHHSRDALPSLSAPPSYPCVSLCVSVCVCVCVCVYSPHPTPYFFFF